MLWFPKDINFYKFCSAVLTACLLVSISGFLRYPTNPLSILSLLFLCVSLSIFIVVLFFKAKDTIKVNEYLKITGYIVGFYRIPSYLENDLTLFNRVQMERNSYYPPKNNALYQTEIVKFTRNIYIYLFIFPGAENPSNVCVIHDRDQRPDLGGVLFYKRP